MNISFERGGYFVLKHMVWPLETSGDMYIDYYMIIENIKDDSKLQKLRDIHQKSLTCCSDPNVRCNNFYEM